MLFADQRRNPIPGSVSFQKESNTLAVCCKVGPTVPSSTPDLLHYMLTIASALFLSFSSEVTGDFHTVATIAKQYIKDIVFVQIN